MYRLLIADDEESIREGVADFVRQNCPEWDVAALARDGREALALAREILPDAVLTDITMPHMNGLEFLESLSDLLPEAKLLVLSGYDQFEYAVQALRLGVSDYLLKPLDTAKLVSALSRFAAELDAQALRWAQIETLRTNTQKTNELELQSYFRAALLGEELPALSAANAVFAQEGTSYCCVLCDGLDAQRALLERVLEQRLYGAVRTVLLRLGTPPRQAVVFCAPRTARAGLFLTLSHALTSIAVSCKRAQALDVHFFVGCIAETPAKLELSYRQSTQARAYAFPEQAAPVTTYEDVLAGKLLPCPEPPEELLRDIPAAVQCGSRAAFVQNCEALFAWFVEREIRRGKTYDAIIMDPPSYGRGPGGEVWKLEDNLYDFVKLCAGVLSERPLFVLINSYTTGLAPSVLGYLLHLLVGAKYGGKCTWDELGLPVTETGLALPCGATGRWCSE